MANTVEQLLIDLKLNTAQIGPQLADLNSKMSRSMAGVESALGKARAAFASLGVAISAGAFAGAIKSQIDLADKMGKLAQSSGVNVRAFSALAYAADLSGTSTEELAGNLARLSARLADAQTGNKQLAAVFGQLGVDAAGPADKALSQIAARFAAMPDGVQKTALALDLFGKSGAAMIPLLNSGSAGIAQLTAEAQRAGKVIDADFSKASETFNDNMRKLTFAGQGFANLIAAGILPQLNRLSGILFEFGTRPELKEGLGKLLAWDPMPIMSPLKQLEAILAIISGNAARAKDAMRGLLGLGPQGEGGSPFERFKDLAVFGARPAGGGAMPASLAAILEQMRQVASVPPGTGTFDQFAALSRGEAFPGSEAALRESIEALIVRPQLPSALEDTRAKMAALRESFLSTYGTPLQNATRELDRLREMLGAGAISSEELAAAQDKLLEIFTAQNVQLPEMNKLLADLRDGMRTWSELGLSAIGDAVLGLSSWRNAARQIISDLGRMLWYLLVVKPLLGSIFGGVAGGLGGIFGRPSAVLPVGLGGGHAAVPLQHGGLALPGRSYIVGEAGEERLTMFDRGGVVIPISGGADSRGTQVIINAPGADLGVVTRLNALMMGRAFKEFIAQQRDMAARTA